MAYLVDTSTLSTVVRCTQCPYWHAFTWTRGEGWDAAARHEALVHPDVFTARDAAAQHRRRHPR
jgi:hypothetical protein